MTFLEKLQAGHPAVIKEYTDAETGKLNYAFGCPWVFDYADSDSLQCAAQTSCCACWNREIPEEKQAEEPVEINLKEEKKMKDLSAVIRNAVLDSIYDSDIEEAVGSFFENYDYSDLIKSSVREYLESNADDIAEDIVNEAVRSYMADNL